MSEPDGTKLYPAWRQAEASLVASGLAYGSIITSEWMDEALGIKPALTIPEYQRNELVRLRQLSALRDSLLEGRKMMLVAESGVGYRVVTPEEQTRLSTHTRTKQLRSAMAKMLREVSNVDTARLNDDQRKENVDALAKLGGLRSIFRKRLRFEP